MLYELGNFKHTETSSTKKLSTQIVTFFHITQTYCQALSQGMNTTLYLMLYLMVHTVGIVITTEAFC